MPKVLVVQNIRGGGPGRFGDQLSAAGHELDVVHGWNGDPVPDRLDPEKHAAMVVLGGGYLPDEDHKAPWLAPTRDLAAQAIDREVPYFGICLGGQLLASVAGGKVRGKHGEPEVGSIPLTLRPEAAEDPLFGGLPESVTAIENHVDAITELPPDARWLAESATCPYQAFGVGASAWGVQFHPEITAERLATWNDDRMRAKGVDPVDVRGKAVRDEPFADPVWRRVADRFAAVVGGA